MLSGCGDSVERDIDRLIEGGDDAEEARIALNLAKKAAVAPLIEAFQEASFPPVHVQISPMHCIGSICAKETTEFSTH